MIIKRVTICLIIILFSSVTICNKGISNDTVKKPVTSNITVKQPKTSYVKKTKQVKSGVTYKKSKRWLNGKPAYVNVLTVNPQNSGAVIKPAYGSHYITSVKRVKDIAAIEYAIAGINASYFKPDSGAPLGTSIVMGKIVTGPLYKRVTFGITKDKEFKMGKIDIDGEISIGNADKLDLFNINQPVFSKKSFSIFTDQWGKKTPVTSPYYSHLVVKDDTLKYIKNSSVPIPEGGYVIVGPHSQLPKNFVVGDNVNYTVKIKPDGWEDVEYAVGGGPYLIKEGKIFIDRQKFSKHFLWSKAPRTAVGYTKSGTLVLVTIDGRRKGFSEGANLIELARIMKELGCYNAMNLDGGTSTQMVYKGKLVNDPTIKGGSKVTNALMIILPTLNTPPSSV